MELVDLAPGGFRKQLWDALKKYAVRREGYPALTVGETSRPEGGGRGVWKLLRGSSIWFQCGRGRGQSLDPRQVTAGLTVQELAVREAAERRLLEYLQDRLDVSVEERIKVPQARGVGCREV